MPYSLPHPAELIRDKGPVLELARTYLAQMAKASPEMQVKAACVTAAEQLMIRQLSNDLEWAITEQLRSFELINGDRGEGGEVVWDELLTFRLEDELAAVRERIGAEAFDAFVQETRLHEIGRPAEVAKDLAATIANAYHPTTENIGKWLSAIGIVQSDMQALMSEAETPPPVNGTHAAALGEPTKEELTRGYAEFHRGVDFEPSAFAKRLDMARNTLFNYISGKTPAKCNAKQAGIILADIERRIVALRDAAEIFGRIGSSPAH